MAGETQPQQGEGRAIAQQMAKRARGRLSREQKIETHLLRKSFKYHKLSFKDKKGSGKERLLNLEDDTSCSQVNSWLECCSSIGRDEEELRRWVGMTTRGSVNLPSEFKTLSNLRHQRLACNACKQGLDAEYVKAVFYNTLHTRCFLHVTSLAVQRVVRKLVILSSVRSG
jgi:hypothetical protein